MKPLITLLLLILLYSCQNSPQDQVKDKITSYIRAKAMNPGSYKPISFSPIDTVQHKGHESSVMNIYKPKYKYFVNHLYEIENSDQEKVKLDVSFYFDSLLNVVKTSPTGINGNYGKLEGNVYWKYNNFIGNKPDAGSTVTVYALDSLNRGFKAETTCDVMGNFNFDKLLPGRYLMVTQSKNTTDSPDELLRHLLNYSNYLFDLFEYDVYKSNENELKQYHKEDSLYYQAISANYKTLDDLSNNINTYAKLEKQKMQLAEDIIKKFPIEFCSKIGFYGPYSNKIDVSTVLIDDSKTTSEVVDFGITYF